MSAAGACQTSAGASAAQIYLDYGGLLRRVAIRKFDVPADDAQALVHDVFIGYLASPQRVRTDLRAYLIGCICNACRNYWRSRHREARVFPVRAHEVSNAVASGDVYEGLALNLVVASTLAKLGGRCREALRRYYLRGERTSAVATAMKTTPGNVNYLMHICRKRARAVYDQLTQVR